MRALIIGAGASLAECIAANVPNEYHFPLIRNFASKTWFISDPGPYLFLYLNSLNIKISESDQIRMHEIFFELEKQGTTNIERFFEFAWINREHPFVLLQRKLIQIEIELSPWENMIYHCIGNPMNSLMLQAFHQNGLGFVKFSESAKIIDKLDYNDLILNLNYDTVFEIALEQKSKPFQYMCSESVPTKITVFKPHGSINMVTAKDGKFAFGQPEWTGVPSPKGWMSFVGLMPPRLNKNYEQHPISATIVDNMLRYPDPNIMTFWGVGITESDIDLLKIYAQWASKISKIEVINPDSTISDRISNLLGKPARWYSSVDEWVKD